jgi:hypothetical protein
MQGEPKLGRPSDVGGVASGFPASGSGTSMSKKSFPEGITPNNFSVVKNTLQLAIDFDWTKSKTIEELRKSAGMTVRDARELVKSEFQNVKRWEDDDQEVS